ncbi:outer membrane beta-barrel protein [Neolewinella maritima]|uniref:outer membrane beta-barrel protein n=1 Tax=Neolewinella maritima TaxID=1383882 RepID=UPI001EE7C7B3|nr:outer membrane beta-barrel protein [Neolewinella maritima]
MRSFWWLLVCAGNLLYAQSPGLLPPDVATRALGGAGLTQSGAAALWTNPAGLAGTAQFSGNATVEQRFGLSDLRLAGIALAVPGGFGLRLAHYGYAGYAQTTLVGMYGRSLTNRLDIGLELGGAMLAVPQHEGRSAATAGLGARYRMAENWSVAASYRTFVGEQPYSTYRLGIGYRPGAQLALHAEVSYTGRTSLQFHMGIEYTLAERVVLRIGVDSGRREVSGGIGYLMDGGVELALTTAYHEQLGLTPVAGIIFRPE